VNPSGDVSWGPAAINRPLYETAPHGMGLNPAGQPVLPRSGGVALSAAFQRRAFWTNPIPCFEYGVLRKTNMRAKEEIVFHVSKKKVGLGIVVQIVMLWLFWLIASIEPTLDGRLVAAKLIGIILFIVFVLILLASAKKLFEKSPILVINSIGISGSGFELIPWRKIKSLSVAKSFRSGNDINLNLFDSKRPVKIKSNNIDLSFDELAAMIRQYYKKYGP
jgi:hypothetical protein